MVWGTWKFLCKVLSMMMVQEEDARENEEGISCEILFLRDSPVKATPDRKCKPVIFGMHILT